MARRRQQLDDALDVGNEAHVEHAVGLVDDQDLHGAHHQLAALEVVQQAARRGDQDIDATVDLPVLVGEGHAADDERHRELVILAVDLEALRDLGGELACRLEDERSRHAGSDPSVGQDIDHRQRERSGLAGPGLRAPKHVAALQDVRNRLGLDRCRLGVSGLGHRPLNFGAQAETGEAGVRLTHLVRDLDDAVADRVSAITIATSMPPGSPAGPCAM